MLRNPFVQVALWALAIGTFFTIVVLNVGWLPKEASTQAKDIDTFYNVLAVISSYIFGLVVAIIIVVLTNFRRRHGDMSDGEPIHGNTRLEVVWTSIPLILMVGAAAAAALLLRNIEEPKAATKTIRVTAEQFAWTFKYPQGFRANELHLVKGDNYYFKINTKDVIHSFWVPEFRMKKDAVPGMTTTIRVTPTRNGRYALVCAELCGLGHSTMRAPVVVQDRASFTAWAEQASARQSDVGSNAPGIKSPKQVRDAEAASSTEGAQK